MERSRDLQMLRYLPKNSLSAPHLGIKLCLTLRSMLKQHTTLLGSFPGSLKALLHKRAYLSCVSSCSASLSRFCPAPTPPHE